MICLDLGQFEVTGGSSLVLQISTACAMFAEPKSVAADSHIFCQGHQVWRGSSCHYASRCGAACRCCASNDGSKGPHCRHRAILWLSQGDQRWRHSGQEH